MTAVAESDQVRRIVGSALLARHKVMDIEIARWESLTTRAARGVVAGEDGLASRMPA